MFKVLVADADSSTVSLIENVLSDKLKEAKLVGVAKNGNEAVVDTINLEPDLIIIAVKLTGINGLETIRQIRGFNKSVHIIIISAYDYFEFAKEAMLLGVNNYLLKPVNVQQIYEAIKHEFVSLEEESSKNRKFREEEHVFNTALRYVEHNFIYGILFNPGYTSEINQYMELIGVGKIGYMMNIVISKGYKEQYLDLDRIFTQMQRRVKTIISTRDNCAIGPQMMNRLLVYITCDKGKEAKEIQIESVKVARQVHAGLKETFGIDTFIGIGGVKPIESIHESYLETLRCIKYMEEGPVIHYKEIRYKSYSTGQEYYELMNTLVEGVKYNRYEIHDTFSGIIESLRPYSSVERISKLIELLFVISYEANKEYKVQNLGFDYYLDYNDVLNYTVEEQESWAWRRFNTLLRALKNEKVDRKTSIVNVAIGHINSHFTENITLNDIASYVNLSPQHFSKIFKEATGFGFVEWVNNLRITKARELINNTDKTIKEICFLVGYNDPNYFSRIFKKYVGISPTDYMLEREKRDDSIEAKS